MRWFTLILFICLVTLTGAALASPDDFSSSTFKSPVGAIEWIPSALDEQPDTIRYDDGGTSSFQPQLNYWCRVRFTAPADFTLHEVYLLLVDGNLSAATCDIYIYGPNGPVAGQSLATSVIPSPLPAFGWTQGTLNQTVDIAAGTDFYVVFGPVPGGSQGTTGYKPILDSGTTTQRSGWVNSNNQFGTYITQTGGDWLVRAGGVVEAFVDVAATDCFDETAGGVASFNVLPDEQLILRTRVENMGTAAIAAYSVTWSVEGPEGDVVFNETVNATNLAVGASAIISPTGNFIVTDEGEYMVTSLVDAENDALAENDEAFLRFFVGDNHRWYRYDDNEEPDNYSGFSEGNGWGLSFTPVSYPAKVTRIRMGVSGIGDADFRIYLNTAEDGGPAGDAVWTGTPAITVDGWVEVDVVPPVNLFEGESFTVCHIYHTVAGLTHGNDVDQPNQAGNDGMPIIAYQPSGGGVEWFADDGGNLCIQAYIDTSSAVPPFPMFEASVAQLSFGDVQAGTSSSQTFWVYNRGAVDDLNITAYTYTPAAFSTIYTFAPSLYTVAAGDSQEVTATFSPALVRSYPGRVVVTNNSVNTPSYQIMLLGTGIANAVDDPANGMPREFALSQNYPNPFNPTTEIQFALPYDSNVELTVLNLLGQEVATIASGFQTAGIHTVSFRASDLPSGLYFYRLEAGDFSAIRKMMLLK